VAVVPTYFRPQFHKHGGKVCGGAQLVVTDAARFRPYRTGVEHVKGLSAAFSGADLMAIERDNALRILPRLKA